MFISQNTYSHFANYRFSSPKLQIFISQTTDFHFVSLHFVSQSTVSPEKMVKFNSDLSLYGPSNITLLYPVKTEVRYMLWGTEPLTLQRYHEELGKPFNRITLYLCKATAILDAMFFKKVQQ